MTAAPYPIAGNIFDLDGSTALQSAVVTARLLRNIDDAFLPGAARSVTNVLGEYTIDMANVTTDYQNGDLVKVYVYKPGSKNFASYETQIDTGEGAETKNITTAKITYCTPQEVAEAAGMEGIPAIDGNPNVVEFCDKIVDAEDYINNETQHSWKTITVTNEFRATAQGSYLHGAGIPINLRHRALKTHSSADGDKVEKWNGNTYVDWTADKTEGRANDFWFDTEKGVLFIKEGFWTSMPQNLRISYRYGESTVPGDIRKCCKLIAAKQFLTGDVRSARLPGGQQSPMGHSEVINQWNVEIRRILANRSEIPVVAMTSLYRTS